MRWLTAACVAALSLAPNQEGLKIANVRPTHGVLGPAHPPDEPLGKVAHQPG